MERDVLEKLDAVDRKMDELREQMVVLRGVSIELHREVAMRRNPVAMLADKVTVRRYNGVKVDGRGVVSPRYDLDCTGAHFREVAKSIHKPLAHYKAENSCDYRCRLYWRDLTGNPPGKFAQMVSELNAVYNKYWAMLHPYVELVHLDGRNETKEIHYQEDNQ